MDGDGLLRDGNADAAWLLILVLCQGERDTFGSRAEVGDYDLSASIQLQWLADGDDSFKPRRRSGHTEAHNLVAASQTIVDFVGRLS